MNLYDKDLFCYACVYEYSRDLLPGSVTSSTDSKWLGVTITAMYKRYINSILLLLLLIIIIIIIIIIWTLISRNTSQVLNTVMNYQVSLNSNEAESLVVFSVNKNTSI